MILPNRIPLNWNLCLFSFRLLDVASFLLLLLFGSSQMGEKKTCGREIDVRAQPTLVIQFTSLQLAFGVLQQLLVRRQIGFKVKFDERFFLSLDEEKKTFRRNIC